MAGASTAVPSLTISILSSQCLVRVGLRKILESSVTVPIVVYPSQRETPDGVPTDTRVDVFILDLETVPDAIGTIKQIRESAPTSKIVLLSGVEDQQRLHEVFAYGADGVILKVQPPVVMLATIEAFYVPAHRSVHAERNEAVSVDLGKTSMQEVDSETQPAMWSDALTKREREVT
ncbi:MAG: response regulator [Nitrospira sp.]